VGLPDGEEIMTLAFFASFSLGWQYRRMTCRRTDRQTRCGRKDPR